MANNYLTQGNGATLTDAQQKLCDDTVAKIRQFESEALTAVAEVGAALVKVKEELGHGRFGKWLTAEVGYTARTAQNYMNVAQTFGDKPEIVSQLPKTVTYKLASMPDDKRKEIVGLIKDPAHPPVKEIKDRISNVEFAAREAGKAKKIADEEAAKEAKRSPAAKKARKEKREKEEAENEAAMKKRNARQAKVKQDAADLAAKMDSALLADLLALLATNSIYEVQQALNEAMTPIEDVEIVATDAELDDLSELDLDEAA